MEGENAGSRVVEVWRILKYDGKRWEAMDVVQGAGGVNVVS